jgi:glyoxylase-like metal-dependent hydrolase (beta-lactamase superfamily II)
MAWSSFIYPKHPIDLGRRVRALSEDGSIDVLPEWRWIHTPGHTVGHVSLFRDDDGLLIAGDAFVTIKAESLVANVTLTPEIHRPPAYFTPDWPAAQASIERLATLNPSVAATGHGVPVYGPALRDDLWRLAIEFDRIGLPAHGRYREIPALVDAQSGLVRLPPLPIAPYLKVAGLLALVGLAVWGVAHAREDE